MKSLLSRRLFVLAVYGGYADLVYALYGAGLDSMMLNSFPAAILAIASWAGVGLFASQRPYWGWGHAPASDIDEWQLKVRLNAYWIAYSIFATGVFVSLVALSFASDLLRIESWRADYAPGATWAVFLLIMTLPSAILMWTDRPAVFEGD